MEVTVVYLTVQHLCIQIEVLTIDMSEDSNVLCTSLNRKRDRERITVSTREEVVL